MEKLPAIRRALERACRELAVDGQGITILLRDRIVARTLALVGEQLADERASQTAPVNPKP